LGCPCFVDVEKNCVAELVEADKSPIVLIDEEVDRVDRVDEGVEVG
jgi:hypothetical protein